MAVAGAIREWVLPLLMVLTTGLAWAAEAPTPKGLLGQLNGATIDPSEIYVLRNQDIVRDRVRIYFHRGFVGFFKKVAGETTGAVFEGEGDILLIPPNAAEKLSLARFTGSPILEEQFKSVLMRFTDHTAQELLRQARKPDPEDPEQPTGLIARWNPIVQQPGAKDSIRILEDVIGEHDLPLFDARIEGLHLGSFEVMDDERLQEPVVVAGAAGRQGGITSSIWCSFPSRASETRSPGKPESARVSSYEINTRINPDNSLEGHAVLHLQSESSQDRVLTFEISDGLTVSEVRDDAGNALDFFQRPVGPQFSPTLQPDDRLSVILPGPRQVGSLFQLRFAYHGDVITDRGNGVLFVGSRGSWYPNMLGQRARFDLTFEYPDRLTLVATGDRVEETRSEGGKRSRWVSDGLFPVAGFNLGAYDTRVRHVGGVTIEVYATTSAETALQRRYQASESHHDEQVFHKRGRRGEELAIISPPPAPTLDPAALLDPVAERAAGAVRYFETLFGPFEYPRLAISQIPGAFGQGWPELVYLPTLSFLLPDERSKLDLGGESTEIFARSVIAHEIAHQWWGNAVGWKTYHDVWLSEGLASFAAALFMAQEKGGKGDLHKILLSDKRDLLQKTTGGKTIESGGPIWLGWRLSNSLDPEGYANIVYKKSCWVLQMLRMLLTDPGTGSDARFFRLLYDFAGAYRGRSPSTQDFVRFANQYLPSQADLDHDHSLEWFFEEWVYSTGIPVYTLKESTRQLGPHRFAIRGTIEQTGVPDDFEMLVPLAVVDPGGKESRLGSVPVGSSGGTFQFMIRSKPSRVEIDENSILAIVH